MTNSIEMQEVTLASWHRHLAACIFEPTDIGARCGVLFIHGHGSNQRGYEHRARLVSHNLAAVCLTFDLSGHGRDFASLERYSVYDHLNDVVAAYDYLASHGTVDRTRIGVCGASYGGYLAALLTAHRVVKRLILRAPSLADDIDFPTSEGSLFACKEAPEGFDSLAVLGCYVGEVLIVESEKDEVIPASHIAAYSRACARAKRQVIPEAAHALTDSRWDEIFVNAIVSWFRCL